MKTKKYLLLHMLLFFVLIMPFGTTISRVEPAKEIDMGECSLSLPDGFQPSTKNEDNYWEDTNLGSGMIKRRLLSKTSLDKYKDESMFTLSHSEKINNLDLLIYSYSIGDTKKDVSLLLSSSYYMELFNKDLPFVREIAFSCE